jgi:hypothetical protein
MLHSAECFSPRIAYELRAMQSKLISIENIFNKNAALCCIAGSHDSALCSIAHIHEFLHEFETEFENILRCYSGAKGQKIYEKNQPVRLSL